MMTERDEEAGGRGKQQSSGKPEGEVTGHGQADKARVRVKTRAELLKISLTQQSLCCHEFQSCVSRESGSRYGYMIPHTRKSKQAGSVGQYGAPRNPTPCLATRIPARSERATNGLFNGLIS